MAAPDKAEVKAETRTMPRFDFVIEFNDGHNRNLMWTPEKTSMRGGWSRSVLANVSTDDNFADMPDLPGQCLKLHSGERTLKIYDPLGLEANAALLAKAAKVNEVCFGTKPGPAPTIEKRNLSDDQIKSNAYWARRMLDMGQVILRHGRIPEMREIEAMPGEVPIGIFNNKASALKEPRPPYQSPSTHNEDGAEIGKPVYA
jgi:hypothetical protein